MPIYYGLKIKCGRRRCSNKNWRIKAFIRALTARYSVASIIIVFRNKNNLIKSFSNFTCYLPASW